MTHAQKRKRQQPVVILIISNNCLTDREKSVIIGHNRSSNPSGELKTRVGGGDRSTIFGRSVRPNTARNEDTHEKLANARRGHLQPGISTPMKSSTIWAT